MHHLSTSFVLAYHGCDRALGERLLSGSKSLEPSSNDFDWLGPGVYFWESNPHRALEFATEKLMRGEGIHKPYVVGAVIDLGLCLDFTTKDSIENLRDAHRSLKETVGPTGGPLPVNGPENWRRRLDCAVIRFLHLIGQNSASQPIDTVEASLRNVIRYTSALIFLKGHMCRLQWSIWLVSKQYFECPER